MNMGWIRQSLGRKVMAMVCAISVLVFGIMLAVTLRWQQSLALERLAKSERQLALSMKLAVDAAMEQGDRNQMDGFFRRAGTQIPEVDMHLVVPDRKIGFSTRSELLKTDPAALLPSKELNATLARSLEEPVDTGSMVALAGVPHYVHVMTIANEARCYGCHDAKIKVLGSMVLLQDMSADWKAMRSQGWVLAGLSLAGMGLLVAAVWLFIRREITRPLAGFGGVLAQVATGDLRPAPEPDAPDEVGAMGRALGRTIRGLRDALGEVARSERQVASSSNQLLTLFDRIDADTRATSSRASTVAAAAEELSVNSATVAAAMEQATTNLAHVAEATAQMSTTFTQIAGDSARARTITGEANLQAEGMNKLMQDLGAAAREIGQVTETITNISSQTNLLSLNATIEAARAGAAGKGFAVVAGEIKALAQQTAAATEDIKVRVAAIQGSATGAVADIHRIGGVIREVSETVTVIATGIEEQFVTTRNIAENLAQAAAGVQDANARVSQTSAVTQTIARDISSVDSAARDTNDSTREAHASTRELSVMAGNLSKVLAEFKF